MLVVDASSLFEVVAATPSAGPVRARLGADRDQAAPHLIDAEVLGIIRRHRTSGNLDETAAAQAVEDLRNWPSGRNGHRVLLARAWELRHEVRSWDALYLALAGALGAVLITADRRLAMAKGVRCSVEVLPR